MTDRSTHRDRDGNALDQSFPETGRTHIRKYDVDSAEEEAQESHRSGKSSARSVDKSVNKTKNSSRRNRNNTSIFSRFSKKKEPKKKSRAELQLEEEEKAMQVNVGAKKETVKKDHEAEKALLNEI